jgi:glycosyltransferase involved in cell wall biosynthesis
MVPGEWAGKLRRYLGRHPRQGAVAPDLSKLDRRVRRPVGPALAADPASEEVGQPVLATRAPSVPVVAVVHPRWYGVTTSTENNFPNVLLLGEGREAGAAGLVLEHGFETVVLSGLPPASVTLARELKHRAPDVHILCHYHASFAQNAEPEVLGRFLLLVQMAREGTIERVGLVKAGMAWALARTGLPARYLPNRVAAARCVRPGPAGSPRRVGVFARDILRKNAHTQLVAAALLDDVEVHGGDLPDVSYLAGHGRFIAHGELPYEQFLALLGEMDLSLCVSLSECYPMVVVESLMRGVPCLTSHCHEILAHDDGLAQSLIVSAHDNPEAIARQAEAVLADRPRLSRRCASYALELNAIAEKAINEFVDFEVYPNVRPSGRQPSNGGG